MRKDLLNELSSNNFTLLIGHVLGVDHAGHSYNSDHREIERKLNDTEKLIQEIIDSMDNDTTLLVFGDHGMTNEGNHGGASEQELRSILFGYSKQGFNKIGDFSDKIRNSVKQMDIPSIASSILGISRPLQNLGVLNPWFYSGTQLKEELLA